MSTRSKEKRKEIRQGQKQSEVELVKNEARKEERRSQEYRKMREVERSQAREGDRGGRISEEHETELDTCQS